MGEVLSPEPFAVGRGYQVPHLPSLRVRSMAAAVASGLGMVAAEVTAADFDPRVPDVRQAYAIPLTAGKISSAVAGLEPLAGVIPTLPTRSSGTCSCFSQISLLPALNVPGGTTVDLSA